MPTTTSAVSAAQRPGTARRTRRTWWLLVAAIAVIALAVGLVVSLQLRSNNVTPPHPNLSLSRERLVWSDEFPGHRLDAGKWTVEDRSTFGDGNHELACLMNRPDNVRVAAGRLQLVVRRESPPLPCGDHDPRFPGGRPYSSTMITTQGRAAWHTGTFEVRAKLPTGARSAGLWPAFWMRPVSRADGTGEIDVFEAIGSSSGSGPETRVVHQTLWADGGGSAKRSVVAPVGAGGPSAGFHTYTVQWRGDSVAWYVDGRRTLYVDRHDAPWLASALRGKFFLRLNVAVGGSWPGAPTAATKLPQAMIVDWVRVYQDVR
jgi:beta-glucanase (GH16 family)